MKPILKLSAWKMFASLHEWNCKSSFYKIIGYKMFHNFKMCTPFAKGGTSCNSFRSIEIACPWSIKCELNFYAQHYDAEILKYLTS